MNLSPSQQEFINAVERGENIFLTGKAGTGKSTVTRMAIDLLNSKNIKTIAIAPTGIAANNIGGATIHSTFSLSPFGVLTYETCNFLKSAKRQVLQATKAIIIDEVSMLRPDILDAINWTLIKNGCSPLSEYQIIFVGDMKQLEAPIDDNMLSVMLQTYDGREFQNAKIYKKLNVKEIDLIEMQRQSDPDFIEALNIVRDGGKSEYFRQFVSSEPNGVVLAPHNSTVTRYNFDGYNKIDSKEITFTAVIEGNVKGSDFNVDAEIKMKDGCKIMYLANSKNNNLINGTLGTFRIEGEKYFIEVGSVRYAIEEQIFVKKEYVLNTYADKLELQEIGKMIQVPIKLAYALTIHKSQGLTFEEATIDLTLPCFSAGQLYVALSRLKSPKGLRIITQSAVRQ